MPRRRGIQTNPSPSLNHDLIDEEGLAQLQQAIQQSTPAPKDNDHVDEDEDDGGRDGGDSDGNVDEFNAAAAATAATGNVNTFNNPPPTDGARNPIAPGADYSSLRLITRRAPRDPEAVLAGVDIVNADLSWVPRDDDNTGLDPNGQPWRYPKKRPNGAGSNLDEFKDEIKEMTEGGKGCKAISEILVAKGVDTSARAVARQRLKWGLRQRAKRRMTEQGLANIRKAHAEQVKRMGNREPAPVRRVRIRVMRKAEITRMTNEGMTAAQIAENLTARGVDLKRGAATVERLRSVWGLVTSAPGRSLEAIRGTARNQALRYQKEQFQNIARELGVEDVDAWVKSKMDEDVAHFARREYANNLMGDAAPKPLTEAQRQGNIEYNRRLREERQARKKGTVSQGSPGLTPVGSAGPEAGFHNHTIRAFGSATPTSTEGTPAMVAEPSAPPAEVIELLDEDDDDDTEDEDMNEDGLKSQTLAVEDPEPAPVAMDVDEPEVTQDNNAVQQHEAPQYPAPSPNEDALQNLTDPKLKTIFLLKEFRRGRPRTKAREPAPQQPPPQHQQPPNITTAPPAGFPGRPIAPHPGPAAAPRPLAPRVLAMRPLAPLGPPFHPTKSEADLMASFGLYAFPTQGKPPQKYLTPEGMFHTEGYEYLPLQPGTAAPEPLPVPQRNPYQQLSPACPQAGGPPPYAHPVPFGPAPGQDYMIVGMPPPPLPQQYQQAPKPVSRVPAPPLVMPPEEVARHRAQYKALETYHEATKEVMDLLKARADGVSVALSLTGLPPSLKDIEGAKARLKEAVNMLTNYSNIF